MVNSVKRSFGLPFISFAVWFLFSHPPLHPSLSLLSLHVPVFLCLFRSDVCFCSVHWLCHFVQCRWGLISRHEIASNCSYAEGNRNDKINWCFMVGRGVGKKPSDRTAYHTKLKWIFHSMAQIFSRAKCLLPLIRRPYLGNFIWMYSRQMREGEVTMRARRGAVGCGEKLKVGRSRGF